MRGTEIDFEDCLALAQAHKDEIDFERLREHFHKLVDYEVAEDRIRPHMDAFLNRLIERGIQVHGRS